MCIRDSRYTLTGASCANFILSNNGGSQSPDLSTCSEIWVTEGQWPNKTQSGAAPAELSVEVFPVPADQLVNFRLQGAAADATVAIYDLNGRSLGALSGQDDYALLTTELPAGMYYYRVTSGDALLTGRFQVHH